MDPTRLRMDDDDSDRRMMISKIFTLFKRAVSLLEAREFSYCASFVVVDRRRLLLLSIARTSPLTLDGAVVVAPLIQTQRRFHYNNTVAATFISMLRLQGSSSQMATEGSTE
jgi:hypothetical protein